MNELQHEWQGLRIKRWLNPPRFPSWSERFPELKISREEYKGVISEVFDFTLPKTWWEFGKKKSGKSTFIEWILLNVILFGGVGLDIFSSDDNEALGWLRSLWANSWKILLVIGDMVDLAFQDESRYPNVKVMHVKEFHVSTIDEFDLIITVPSFYINRSEMYLALSHIVELFRSRASRGWEKVCMMGVREARELMNSRWEAGAANNQQEAEKDFININGQAEHNGGGLALDSLRPMSITIQVRDLADYVVMKRLGRLQVPEELDYMFRFVSWKYARKMPIKDFIVYTDTDDIFYGDCDPIDWHVKRGENMLRNLGIWITAKPQSEVKQEKKQSPGKDEFMQNHLKIIPLTKEVNPETEKIFSLQEIASKLGLNRGTVVTHLSRHRARTCSCEL